MAKTSVQLKRLSKKFLGVVSAFALCATTVSLPGSAQAKEITQPLGLNQAIVTVTKDWSDEGFKTVRPESVTVNVGKNKVVLEAKDGYKKTIIVDAFDKDGKVINYAVSEDEVLGYEAEVTKGVDKKNNLIIASEGITFSTKLQQQKCNGECTLPVSDNSIVAIRYNEKNFAIWTPIKLSKDLEAKTIEKIQTAMKGDKQFGLIGSKNSFFISGINGSAPKFEIKDGKFKIKNKEFSAIASGKMLTNLEASVEVANTYKNETVDVEFENIWDDDENRDGLRKDFSVKLLKDGKEVETTSIKINETTGKFENLPKYEKGKEVEYTIEVEEIEGYETKISGDAENGFSIKNTHEPEMTSVSVKIEWDDEENKDEIRPGFVTVALEGGKESKEIFVSEAEGWEYTFDDLFAYEDGEKIEYRLTQKAVKGYQTTFADGTFTNTHTVAKGGKGSEEKIEPVAPVLAPNTGAKTVVKVAAKTTTSVSTSSVILGTLVAATLGIFVAFVFKKSRA